MESSYFESRTRLLHEALKQYLNFGKEQPAVLYKAMNYAIFSGGKRLRPILFFATYEMLKQSIEIEQLKPLLPIAIALEMVHTASLIHDDLPALDNSPIRRGVKSCHLKYDPATAILAGDALLTKAFEMISLYDNKEIGVQIVQLLCNSISTRGMIGGQTVDLLSAKKQVLPLSVLEYIHKKKTGALLEASVKIACACAQAEPTVTQMLSIYAINLGLAYQIIDDLLDDDGDYELLGKEQYEDIRNNRTTYPLIIGHDKAIKMAEKLLDDSYRIIKNMKSNQKLVEFIKLIQDRLP